MEDQVDLNMLLIDESSPKVDDWLGCNGFGGFCSAQPPQQTASSVIVQPNEQNQLSKNAIRCKRHRLKKKEEEDKVYLDNERLKHKRDDYLKQISELELEVQTLRGQGIIDFALENELLRREIKKYKCYVERVLKLSHSTIGETVDEEKLRSVQNAIENGASQIVGLLYSSTDNSTWKQGKPFNLKLEKGKQVRVETWYQYLPIGTPAHQAKRLNVRSDVHDLPCNAEKLGNYYWLTGATAESAKKEFAKLKHLHIELKELFPKTKLQNGAEFVCFSFQSKQDDASKEAAFVYARKLVDLLPTVFGEAKQVCRPKPNKYALCFGITSQIDKLPIKSDHQGKQVVHDLLFQGTIFRETSPNKCTITTISTIPHVENLFGFVNNGKPIINEDGFMDEEYIKAFSLYYDSVLAAL